MKFLLDMWIELAHATTNLKYYLHRIILQEIRDNDPISIVEPLLQDPIQEGRGILKTKGRVLRRLINDRTRGI